MVKVGIMGAGSWGTALALLLHSNGHEVTVWSISEEEVQMLSEKREHESKLPGVKIYKKHGTEYETVCCRWADYCRCCKGY